MSRILSMIILLVTFGCKKENIEKRDSTGAVIKKQFIWKQSLTPNQWIWSGAKEVAVYPGGNGKKPLILTATYQNAYCYEAER